MACSCSFTERQEEKEIFMTDEVMVPNPHAEGAKALAEKVRALIAEIPRLTSPGPNDARRLSSAASVSEEFLESARAVMQKSSLLESASGTNAMTMRDASAFAMAYEVVLPEAEALMRLMAHTVRVAKAAAGESALDVYSIAQRLAKRKDGAELVPHVKDMQRKLKRGRRKATLTPASDKSVKPAPHA
jgi:hypothetical protein